MLDTFTLETFQPFVGQPFAVIVNEERFMPAYLVAAEPLALDGDTRRKRAPFSLTFRGPSGGYLPQDLYRVQSAQFGPVEMFLVPLGPDPEADGVLYEAVFT